MARNLFIDGGAGTVGLEIADRLAERGEFALIRLSDHDRKDPTRRREALADADFAILCLPDSAAREAVAMLGAHSQTRLIDTSTAHRVSTGWVYGLPELDPDRRAKIAKATQLANPGCFASGFLLLAAPLVQAGLVAPTRSLHCHGVSGYSGGGKALIARFENDKTLGYRSYALALDHKHLPEMQAYSGLATAPIFAPAVVPAYRGMVVEIPLHFDKPMATQIYDCFAAHYRDSRLVTVHPLATDETTDSLESTETPEIILHSDSLPSDRVTLTIATNQRGDRLRLIAQFDNLGKGASGACVQNLNLMAELDEHIGLRL